MRALILGVTGQDGSYLAEQLLADGHEVWGMTRRPRVRVPGVHLVPGDLLDQASLEQVLRAVEPDEVYNLAAVTAPGAGWDRPQPPLLAEVTGVGVVRLLEAMLRVCPGARLVHASSSSIYDPHRYGLYGASKVLAHEAIIGYRDRLHASNAIFYSHTSPRQDPRFLARRITSVIARIGIGAKSRLLLTDPDARRDWGFAQDYVEALPLMARRDVPGDYVVATGEAHSVRDLTETALAAAGLTWAQAVDVARRAPKVPDDIDPDRDGLLSATRALGWSPVTPFSKWVALMVYTATKEACNAR